MVRPTVVAPGDQVEAQAIRLNDDGEGVVSIHGFTVFVPGLLPGEHGLLRLNTVAKTFGTASLLKRFTTCDLRKEAPCPVFQRCGGCQLQHIPYETQLKHKQETVENAFRRVGHFTDTTVLPTIGMETPWRYRNNIQVPVKFFGSAGEAGLSGNSVRERAVSSSHGNFCCGEGAVYRGHTFELGFYAPDSHTLVPTDVCLLIPADMEETVRQSAAILAERLGTKARHIHHLILRRSFSDEELLVAIATERPLGHTGMIAAKAMTDLPKVAGVVETIQGRDATSVWGPGVTLLAGQDRLKQRLGNLEFLISAQSFFQVNPVQTEVLYSKVAELLQVGSEDSLLDLYCGAGTIGLSLAHRVRRVTGIESNPAAVADAKENAMHNHIRNVEFIFGRAEEELERMAREGTRYEAAVLDPPRKGCHPRLLQAVLKIRPQQIVYVSCNPATLARDVRVMVDSGYQMGAVQPVDMFPQTAHVECCLLLTKRAVGASG